MTLTVQFEKALTLATRLHRTYTRKGRDIPYIAHLLGVTSIALDHGANEDKAIAALRHDAVEDQGGAKTVNRIRRHFGSTVADIVWGCPDTDEVPTPPWRQRKEAYIAHIYSASPSVLRVSASDKLHDARAILSDYRCMGDQLWARFAGGKDGTLWYYRALVEAFQGSGMNRQLVADLDLTVTDIERLASTRAVPFPFRMTCVFATGLMVGELIQRLARLFLLRGLPSRLFRCH